MVYLHPYITMIMNKILLLVSGIIISGISFTQQQFENGNMESWDGLATPQEEPSNWSSLKTADALSGSAPQVLEQDAGHNGGFCARLESTSVFFVPANGIMTNGRVHADFDPENGYVYTDATDAEWNTPFTSRPDSLVGWFKYSPDGGDKGKVEVFLHEAAGQIPEAGTSANIIGSARMNITNAEANWTRFAVPFSYVDSRTPEYMLSIVACGDSTISNSGSILWIDDLSFVYNPTNELTEEDLKIKVYSYDNTLNIEGAGVSGALVKVFDLNGSLLLEVENETQISTNYAEGIYLVEVSNQYGVIRKKVFLN